MGHIKPQKRITIFGKSLRNVPNRSKCVCSGVAEELAEWSVARLNAKVMTNPSCQRDKRYTGIHLTLWGCDTSLFKKGARTNWFLLSVGPSMGAIANLNLLSY